MSLRLRLTILYSALTGGILLVFGILLFSLVNYLLINQVDNTLAQTYDTIVARTHINSVLNIAFVPDLDLNSNVLVQVWGSDGTLKLSSRTIAFLTQPLDPLGFKSAQPAHNDAYVGTPRVHMRVLTEPMLYAGDRIGTMQLASEIGMIDSTRNTLLRILLLTALLSMVIAGISSWLSIGRALAPIAAVTDTAQQISKTDDLSRRIPYHGPEHDEVGRLITAFNETLGRLEHLFASQQRFLADVSHELRTPLTVIKGNVDLMRKIGSADEESLIGIEEEADRLTRLVGDLLLETQAESGKLPLYFAPVELDTLLLEVFKEMHFLTHDRIQLKLTEIDQVLVNGDRDRLKQVLINLVSNAINYTPPGGEVYLSLGIVGDNARLIVRDTGPGIPNEDVPHIFERFYRAEKSRSRSKVGGFGLGLSIAYWIVTNHGGRIEVNSAEGKGTTFCIWLPLLNKPTSSS
ncbi:MAG: ATP-binding protein [Anaerolineales bacterium]|jgi:signal transduction histidine kinase